jgi:hypothetical protein
MKLKVKSKKENLLKKFGIGNSEFRIRIILIIYKYGIHFVFSNVGAWRAMPK